MATQHAPNPPPPAAKPVAAHPVFPLSPVELQRWTRFAQKGGIGRARARVDKVSQDAAKDLMFLEGDDIVVLMELGAATYLGFCEGVTGLFSGADVVMRQAKLKRPVVSTRGSSSAVRGPPQPDTALSRRGSTGSLGSASASAPSRSARRKPVDAPEVEVLDERFEPSRPAGAGEGTRRACAGEAFAIAAQGRDAGARQGHKGYDVPQDDAQEILAFARSPELAGAFASPSLSSPNSSSFRRTRDTVTSPAPSSASTATTHTPSLVTSPFSDFIDRDRDDESVSSISGHGQGPFTPAEPSVAWQPAPSRLGAKSSAQDSRDGPTPTTDSFPLDTFPLPAFGELSLEGQAPAPHSSLEEPPRATASFSLSQPQPRAQRPSHVVSASGVPVPLPSPQEPQSAFSFSPNSSITSTLPPSILSATDLYARREAREPKSSGSTIGSSSTSGQHVPGTPTDDPTLAFIFDAYRYSVAQAGDTGRGADSPARSVCDLRTPEALEELAEPDSPAREAPAAVSALRGYGAASHLRRGLSNAAEVVQRPQHQPVASTSTIASLDSVPIPRLSEVFPRSSTLDSLASWATETTGGGQRAGPRGSVSAEARYAMWAPPTPTKDVASRPAPSPRRQSEPERRSLERAGRPAPPPELADAGRAPERLQRQHSVPMSDAANLEEDLAASRRLFHMHFSPPQELVDAAARHARQYRRFDGVDELPSSPRRDSPERLRRKSVKGLQISGPAVPGLQVNPRWRSPEDASPVEQSLPQSGDVFAASPVSLPHVEVFGASPSANPRAYVLPRQREVAQDSQALLPASPSIDSSSSPTASSPQTFASATSSPVAPSFEDPQERNDVRRRAGSGVSLAKKLRKPLHRAKSSPSLGRQHDAASGVSVFSGSGAAPPVPARQDSDPFALSKGKHAASVTSSKESNERRVDYSAGISSKDFEEETVQIGKSEFEMVKPLAALLTRPSEDDDGEGAPQAASLLDPPSRTAADFATPRRPMHPSHPQTPNSALGLATASLSHFSPPTPASVEDGGRGALDDYRKKEAQWIAALGSMTPAQVRKSKKMRALVQAGVPSSVRGKVWSFLAQGDTERPQGLYQTLCQPDDASLSPHVEQDLSATLDHPQFAHGSAGRADIFHVLQAFARFDSELGYFPGLGSVVGLLLTQMPAEDAFWTLVSLVADNGLRQYFPSAREELALETLAFESLLETMEPKLAKRMRELSVSPRDYLAVWHSTLYLTILPQPTVLRLVDLLLFDPKACFRIALALLDLSHLDDRLAFPSRDAALNHLLAPPPTAFEPALLIPAVATTKVSDDKLKKAFAKAAKALKG